MEEYILLRVAKVTRLDLAVSSRLGNATNSSFLCILFSVERLMMTPASDWVNFSMSALVSLLESGGLSHLAAKGRQDIPLWNSVGGREFALAYVCIKQTY